MCRGAGVSAQYPSGAYSDSYECVLMRAWTREVIREEEAAQPTWASS